jgi:hypothetical protein
MIDLRTLIVVIGLTHLVQLAAFIVLYRTNKVYPGIAWWLGWCIAEFAGFSFLLIRQIPSLFEVSVILQNASIVAGPLFIYIGIRRFFGKEVHSKALLGFYLLFFLLLVSFLFIHNDIRTRSLIINLALALISVPTVITVLRDSPRPVKTTALFIGVITALHGIVFFTPFYWGYYCIAWNCFFHAKHPDHRWRKCICDL